VWTENSALVPSVAAADESFGAALATGDFNNDGYDDLAIGVPGEDPAAGGTSAVDGGAASVLRGSASGLTGVTTQIRSQANLEGVHEHGDAFGYSLAAGDFDDDGFDDLAVGVPGEDVGNLRSAGAINVIYGGVNLLTAAGNAILYQGTNGVEG